MKTIQINLYKFSELSKEAQQTAIEKERQYKNESFDLLYFFDDNCKEQAKEQGFNDIKLQYRFSYSQGDGLSFECKDFNIDRFLTNELGETLLKNVILHNSEYKISGNKGRYPYAAKSDVDFYLNTDNWIKYPNIMGKIKELREKLENIYMDLCKDLEKQGYEDIEYQLSDECIIEDLDNNDLEYTENGTVY